MVSSRARGIFDKSRARLLWALMLSLLVLAAPHSSLAVEDAPPAIPEVGDVTGFQGGLGNNATWLLPDLQTLPPSDLRLVAGSDRRLVRFTNSVWNGGPGPLELKGNFNRQDDMISITQIVYRLNGATAGRPIGEFVFHPEHEHWHMDGFAIYQVWSIREDGSLDQVLASSGKVGFCTLDIEKLQPREFHPDLPEQGFGPQRPEYGNCDWARQGISVGWVDIYREHLPDQYVEISDLTQGVYALRSTVNPFQQIMEADQDNNSAVIYFELGENRIKVLEALPRPPQEDDQGIICDCVK
jgi:hypothetical protein